MNKHFFNVDEILDLDSKKLNTWFFETKGLNLYDLKVEDLVFHNGLPILTGNGVYVFKEDKKAIYVGSCVSRNFVERIPAHFDIRHNGWFNSLLVNLIKQEYKRNNKDDKTDENLIRVAKKAFKDLELILVNFPKYDKSAIKKLEDFFKIALKPLNGFKHKTFQNAYININEYIQYNKK